MEFHSVWLIVGGLLFFFFFRFIYFWLHWVFIAARGLSLLSASRGYSLLQCTGFSLWWFSYCRAEALGAWALELWLSSCAAYRLGSRPGGEEPGWWAFPPAFSMESFSPCFSPFLVGTYSLSPILCSQSLQLDSSEPRDQRNPQREGGVSHCSALMKKSTHKTHLFGVFGYISQLFPTSRSEVVV